MAMWVRLGEAVDGGGDPFFYCFTLKPWRKRGADFGQFCFGGFGVHWDLRSRGSRVSPATLWLANTQRR